MCTHGPDKAYESLPCPVILVDSPKVDAECSIMIKQR